MSSVVLKVPQSITDLNPGQVKIPGLYLSYTYHLSEKGKFQIKSGKFIIISANVNILFSLSCLQNVSGICSKIFYFLTSGMLKNTFSRDATGPEIAWKKPSKSEFLIKVRKQFQHVFMLFGLSYGIVK